ncbi:hypothetical protein BO70DRAFT_397596 [Aspergillus heteromorphus CBS 117.55]|uniref:Uncharacterized protein n=1 Tax=Aspergillus heteromorphus CBS 117.55 TaxID=1448321 RepID=A0A317VZG5_9EURO|nr:uncharacterized protein BO70DRAFT_397596 [Aspergillus heteromorphus CBS 117.55]PWY78357.1 hypothetical protein BO70DRAFT_397596 [Aspergillus heteromorphus CBS 117.55]
MSSSQLVVTAPNPPPTNTPTPFQHYIPRLAILFLAVNISAWIWTHRQIGTPSPSPSPALSTFGSTTDPIYGGYNPATYDMGGCSYRRQRLSGRYGYERRHGFLSIVFLWVVMWFWWVWWRKLMLRVVALRILRERGVI